MTRGDKGLRFAEKIVQMDENDAKALEYVKRIRTMPTGGRLNSTLFL